MRAEIDKVVEGVKEKKADHYAHALWSAADAAKKAGDLDTAKALIHVADACSMYMKPDDPAEPFGPMAVFDSKSTAHLGSVTEEMVASMRPFTDPSTDPELRARCADIIWVVKTAAGIIAPARDTIVLEHCVRLRDLAPLTQGHPFVPPGHERAWARILHAGLTGDLETAMHYLGPQMEASIRFVSATHGAIVTAHNDEGIQEELPLNKLLEMPVQSEEPRGPRPRLRRRTHQRRRLLRLVGRPPHDYVRDRDHDAKS